MVTEFEGLVHRAARKYLWAIGPTLDKEDLLQEGRLAAWLNRDNPHGWACSEVTAAAYAARAAIHDSAMDLALAVRIKPSDRGQEAFRAGHGRRSSPAVLERIPDEAGERAMLPNRVRAAWDALEERERAILRGVYYEDKSLADIGREMGVSRERVRQLEARALQKLRSVGGVRNGTQ